MSYYEDEIYHSGYLDGYYASMELYHSDNAEMTDEEKAKARRKRRRRNIALGVAGGLGAAFIYAKAKDDKFNRDWDEAIRAAKEKAKSNLNKSGAETVSSAMRKSAPKPRRTIPGFRRNVSGTYKVPSTSENWIPFSVARDRKLKRKKS